MQVLALVGSPRKEGNSDYLTEHVLKGCSESGAWVEKIYIGDWNILPCQGCMECRKEGKCDLEDNLPALVEKIEEADAIVVAAPIYGNHLPGQFKVLFDRLVGIMHRIDSSTPGKLVTFSRLEQKKRNIGLVAVAGAPREDSCEQALKFLRRVFSPEGNGGICMELRAIGLNTKGQVVMSEAELEQVVSALSVPNPTDYVARMLTRNRTYLEEAYQMGVDLVNK